MSLRARIGLLALGLCLIGSVLPQFAGAALFKTSIRGTQHLQWSMDGTRGSCEIRRGTGNGTTDFAFKSSKSQLLFASKSGKGLSLLGSIPSVATGSITGQLSDTLATACSGFEPQPPLIQPTTDCGSTKFGIRVDLQSRGAYTYVTGPYVLGGAFSDIGGNCPSPLNNSLYMSTDLSECGDGVDIWKRSWGVSSSTGAGLFASKLHISAKKLLKTKKGRTAVITGSSVVSCKPIGWYSGVVTVEGKLKYTLSLKRTG